MPRLFNPGTVFTDNSGQPASGGTVTFYESGTTTLKDTYSDVDQTTVNPNPITLDSDGTFPNEVFGSGSYTTHVKDANGATLPGSEDDFDQGEREYTVATLPTASTHKGVWIYVSDETGGAVMAFSDGTSWRRCTDRAIVS